MNFLVDGDRRYLPLENGYLIKGLDLDFLLFLIVPSEVSTMIPLVQRLPQERTKLG
jgi:hypothetical protein